ncbi:hypothetical protein [Ciceribacter sp. L1K22]|uniref:hypothetical protein n=1 Tax=Ciceribacter sp. L1K22 TaxID=2820275 RepID=UPI001ABEA159|nr:hypothetical protein [Ciceribacter sp. L1K22]MBO3760381.1 hypothetical protein [Ciceribacter sp. L1K22]
MDESGNKAPWWASGWFLGGLLPLAPAIVFTAATLAGTHPATAIALTSPFALALVALVGCTLLFLLVGLLRDVMRSGIGLAIMAIVAALLVGGAIAVTDTPCETEIDLYGRTGCAAR